jgi:hypothetical protein
MPNCSARRAAGYGVAVAVIETGDSEPDVADAV